MTTDAEYRALAENLAKWQKSPRSDLAAVADLLVGQAASAILALLEERDEIFAVKMWRAANEDLDRMKARATLAESRLGKAVEALEKIAGLTDAEAHVCGEMLRNYARSVLSDLEKSE